VTVTDANNQQVTIADSSRIVSIGTANTETLEALGALSRVVGVESVVTKHPSAACPLVVPVPLSGGNADGQNRLR
jgi:ABC-type hemin transport system substrate-binding protein